MTFNKWIASEYDSLRQRLCNRHWLNEDAMHDAYIDIATCSDLNRLAEQNFPTMFLNAYRKAMHRYSTYAITISAMMVDAEKIFPCLADITEEQRQWNIEQQESFQTRLELVEKKIDTTLQPEQATMFKAHFFCGIPINDLADIYGIHRHTVSASINRMCGQIRAACAA